MGFRYEPTIAVITFEKPFEGLEIRAPLDLPATQLLGLMKKAEALQQLAADGDEGEAEAALRQAMEMFVEVTDGWNWENPDGTPLPLTADNLMRVIPGKLAFQLVNRWRETVQGASAPLGEP